MFAGFLVALTDELVGLYSFHHPNAITGLSSAFSKITLWVWPTAIYLIEADENVRGYIMFGISAMANGILYGIVALIITAVWKDVLSPNRRRERAESWWPGKPQDR